ncbi:hypothetical protein DENSPDRAFT_840731 [Dentipellis sp. KUC8613]|nr:hypothetical protein DENSPDRAFT_840731 [Dentipellis sp. KUC8613]
MARALILPRPLFALTLATLTLSAAIFVLAMLDLGTVSFWLNLTGGGVTILHDATLISLARRAARNETPLFFPPAASIMNILFLGVCAFIYTAGLAMTAYSAHFAASGEISWGTPAGMGTIIAQAVIGGINIILLLTTAVWCLRSRKTGREFGYGEF